jgi:hypothetical protein
VLASKHWYNTQVLHLEHLNSEGFLYCVVTNHSLSFNWLTLYMR